MVDFRRAGKNSIYVEGKPILTVETISFAVEVTTLGETGGERINEVEFSKGFLDFS